MLLILVLCACLQTLQGTPLPHPHAHGPISTPAVFDERPVVPDCEDLHRRTVYDILRSCIVTIVACVWTSAHPNINSPLDSWWTRIRRKVLTMLCVVIAPELVLYWALRQRSAATMIVKEYNKKLARAGDAEIKTSSGLWGKIAGPFLPLPRDTARRDRGQPWAMTHGFFIQMGGFILYNKGYPQEVLDYKRLAKLLEDNSVDPPTVTERELQDRSKGDFISKLVVVVQTTWFVVQCIARAQQHLPLTELEVLTLALAVFNAAIYAAWWNKPQRVDTAVCIPLLMKAVDSTTPLTKKKPRLRSKKPPLPHPDNQGPTPPDPPLAHEDSLTKKPPLPHPNNQGPTPPDPPLAHEDSSTKKKPRLRSKKPPLPDNQGPTPPDPPLADEDSPAKKTPLPHPDNQGPTLPDPPLPHEDSSTQKKPRLLLEKPPLPHPDNQGPIPPDPPLAHEDSPTKRKPRLLSKKPPLPHPYNQSLTPPNLPLAHEDSSKQHSSLQRNVLNLLILPITLPYRIVQSVFRSLGNLAGSVELKAGNPLRVPTFYAAEVNDLVQLIALPIVSAIFGGIHLLAWASEFPSHRDTLLWRVSALFLTGAPVLLPLLIFLEDILLFLGLTLITTVYVAARFILIVVAFKAIRHPPNNVLRNVVWTSYIPHF